MAAGPDSLLRYIRGLVRPSEQDGGSGAAGTGGNAGLGIGGGIYNLGTFDLDAASAIHGNHASASDDNIFGPITPI